MKISEAVEITRSAPKDGKAFDVTLICGFTPLHVQTFLSAYLQRALPDCRVTISPGLYGSVIDTVERSIEAQLRNVAIVLEWSDLDPRLGYRAASRWTAEVLQDVIPSVRTALQRLERCVRQIATCAKVVVAMPTLPMPPVFHTSTWQTGETESVLLKLAAELRTELGQAGISVVSEERLAEQSLPGQRYDFKSDLLLGLPYTLAHADALSSSLARLLCPPAPKKGIITDLDDTLWSGLIGEVGPEQVHWDLGTHSQIHGLYQSLLSSLADAGVLVAVASKNDPDVVRRAFSRADILLPSDCIFPMEVHWSPKSESVRRILGAWNVAADAVVFVDDSPLELAEVAAQHPGIECIQFPGRDYGAVYALLRRIRDLFGKPTITLEDSVRLGSLRSSAEFKEAAAATAAEDFLRDLKATVQLEFDCKKDPRAFELVNKTNQFNLNGIRYTESEWVAELSRPETHVLTATYGDRFGRLGKIAAMLGSVEGDALRLRTWVMSCRAFSRRIEHACLQAWFLRYPISRIEFDFAATERNGPLREFLASMPGEEKGPKVVLRREDFERGCPPLYHAVNTGGAEIYGPASEQASKVL